MKNLTFIGTSFWTSCIQVNVIGFQLFLVTFSSCQKKHDSVNFMSFFCQLSFNILFDELELLFDKLFFSKLRRLKNQLIFFTWSTILPSRIKNRFHVFTAVKLLFNYSVK